MEIVERVVEHAQGEPRPLQILFVHGAWRDASAWKPLSSRLASRGWGSFALSLPGHGRSTMHKGEVGHYTLQDGARLLAGELERTTPRPVVVAHDVYAAVALRASALIAPAALALLSPVPLGGLKGAFARLLFRRPATTLRSLFADRFTNPFAGDPEFARAFFLGRDASQDAHEFARTLQPESSTVLAELFLSHELRPRPECPLLVVSPTQGPFPARAQARLAERLDARHVTVPGAPFDLAAEARAEETAALLDGWLRKVLPDAD